MKGRTLVILVVILAVVAGYFFLVEERQRRVAEKERTASRRLLPYGPLDVDAVSFINPYGETLQWERRGDQWLITFPVTDRGEKSTIDMFLTQIVPGQKLEEYTGVEDLSIYGLSPPYATVILESGRYARKDTIYIGGKTPASNRAYVTLGNSGDVSVTRELAHNVMQKQLYHIRDKNFIAPYERDITGFSIHYDGKTLSFERTEGSWKMGGSAITVQRNVVEVWITRLADALIYEFPSEGLADTSSFGIGSPHRAAVIRRSGGEAITVSFGKRRDEFVPVTRTGRDKVMMIEAGFLNAFHWTDDRLVVMNLTVTRPGEVGSLQWETPDSVSSWRIVGERWMSLGDDPAEVDGEEIKYLLMTLSSASFESLVTDKELVATSRPDVIITLGDRSGKVLDIISLLRFSDGSPGGISISGGNAGVLREGVRAEIIRAGSAIAR